MKKIALHWQILLSILLAATLGAFFDQESSLFGVKLVAVLSFIGDMFLRALKMLVMPLIVASIITGVTGVGEHSGIGRLGAKTAFYYVLSSFVAIVIGLIAVMVFEPGIVDGQPAKELIGLSADTGSVAAQVSGHSAGDLVSVFLRMVPENVLADAAKNELLGVIVFSILFGYFATKISAGPRRAIAEFWQAVYEVMLKMTDFVLAFAPIGVLGLVGKVALSTGISAILPLAMFFLTVMVALSLHSFVVIPLVLLSIAKVSPKQFFKFGAPAFLMAFSTASSAGTLPVTMEKMQALGVPRRITSFTLPLGATVNMDGTALYECVAAVFIAQAYGLELGFAELFLVVVVALMTSIGVAGIPAASLVAITLILTTMGLPIEGVGLILAVDRILDMCRTTVNVMSDACASTVIAAWEGEDVLPQTKPSGKPSEK